MELEYIYITNYNAAVFVWNIIQIKVASNINIKQSLFAAPPRTQHIGAIVNSASINVQPNNQLLTLGQNQRAHADVEQNNMSTKNTSLTTSSTVTTATTSNARFIPSLADLNSILKSLKPTDKIKNIVPQNIPLKMSDVKLNKTVTREHLSMVDILKNEFDADKRIDDNYNEISEYYNNYKYMVFKLKKRINRILKLCL